MTPAELELMAEAKIDEERRQRRIRASEICALIWGQRTKKPDLQRLFKDMVGEQKPDLSKFEALIEESHSRVPAGVRERQLLEKELELN